MAGVRFCFEEREVVARGLGMRMSHRAIGKLLGRHHSSVSREIGRNANTHGTYSPLGAQHKADLRALRPKRSLVDDKRLFNMVRTRLVDWKYSPSAAAADLRARGVDISHETIYQAVYNHRFGDPRAVLCRPRRRRKRHTRRGWAPYPLGDITLIDDRPVLDGVGHWEADLLVGKRNKSAVAVVTEKTLRVTLIVAIDNRTADHVRDRLIKAIGHRIPRHLRKTLTVDQGPEFTRWRDIEKRTGFDIYFCHPRSPWEKGLVEQTNSLLRRWLPRRTHFPTDQQTIDRIAKLLNNMPRRSLNWSTSAIEYRKHRVATTA